MSKDKSKEYLLGLSPIELLRLGFQHEIFSEDTHRLLNLIDIAPNMSVIDLGCGPGYISQELARLVGPEGKVVSIDQSEKNTQNLLNVAQAQGLLHLEAKQMPLMDLNYSNEFDVAFARWVFCYLDHPKEALLKVKQALKPGGKFLIMDYIGLDHIVAPNISTYPKVLKALHSAFAKTSHDGLNIMQKIPQYVSELGGTVDQVIPIQRVGRPKKRIWNWVESFYESFLSSLLDSKELKQEDLDVFWQEWNERKENPNAYIFAMPVLGMVISFD